jgi:dTDP-4-dehydrorhamnose reductase
MTKILLLGATGQVGWELHRCLMTVGEVVATTRQDIDLTNNQDIMDAVAAIRPDLLINAAAYTAVERAEDEPEVANQVNGYALEAISICAKKYRFPVIHYSTDYVFDGTKATPYTHEDKPNPINAYGRSKLLGEQILQSSGVPYLIFRTSWIYGMRGKNFLLTMLKLAKERQEIKVVNDQYGTPTWSRFVAQATAHVLVRGIQDVKRYFESCCGIYHLTPSGATNWYEFAKAIFTIFRHDFVQVLPIPSDEYPTKAKRPKFSVLKPNFQQLYADGICPDWFDVLQLATGI